jgi:hypothetical protein
MTELIRLHVRPMYHESDLLVELIDDHRSQGFPNIRIILQEALQSVQEKHPDGLDDPSIAQLHDRYFSYWRYEGGCYEIDDDIWSLFVTAPTNNGAVIADIERALLSTGKFIKEEVDFAKYK